MPVPIDEQLLRSLRRIVRAIEMHGKHLESTIGLTGPQLVCLRVLARYPETTPSAVAHEVFLSPTTLTGIIDRLAARDLITRRRSVSDRRLVKVALTDAGRQLAASAPSSLQDHFLERLAALDPTAQANIRDTLELIGTMMDAGTPATNDNDALAAGEPTDAGNSTTRSGSTRSE